MTRLLAFFVFCCLILLSCRSFRYADLAASQLETYRQQGYTYERLYSEVKPIKKRALAEFSKYTNRDTMYLLETYVLESNTFIGRIWNSEVDLAYESYYPYDKEEVKFTIYSRKKDSILTGSIENYFDFEEHHYLLEDFQLNKIDSLSAQSEISFGIHYYLGSIAYKTGSSWNFKNILFQPFD